MKNLFILFFVVLFIGACSDPCDDVNCLNDGICEEGSCLCPDGYSGVNCEIFDACFNVTCENEGECVDGSCLCARGYVGEFCESEIRAPFTGVWDGAWICDLEPDDLNEDTIEIFISDNDILEVTILLDGEAFFAVVDENGILTIFRQELLSDGDLYFVEGDGKLEGDVLSFEMFIELPAEELETFCDFELNRM